MRIIILIAFNCFLFASCISSDQQQTSKTPGIVEQQKEQIKDAENVSSENQEKITYGFIGEGQKSINVYDRSNKILFSVEAEAGDSRHEFLDSISLDTPASKFLDLIRCNYLNKPVYLVFFESENPDKADISYLLLDTVRNKISLLDPKEKHRIKCPEEDEEFE